MSDWISRQAALPSEHLEPLTDREMRLFLAAMARERQICRDIDNKFGDHELLPMCNAIERKVKAALWET